jgi:hypothetical protein
VGGTTFAAGLVDAASISVGDHSFCLQLENGDVHDMALVKGPAEQANKMQDAVARLLKV